MECKENWRRALNDMYELQKKINVIQSCTYCIFALASIIIHIPVSGSTFHVNEMACLPVSAALQVSIVGCGVNASQVL